MATSGSLYLIFIQVASRALTFTANQVLLRFLSAELLGVAVQLELFSTSVLYFSRESLRVALQRNPQDKVTSTKIGSEKIDHQTLQSQTTINLSYISIFLGLPLTLFLAYSYFQTASLEVLSSPGFEIALQLYAVATIIELLSEPSFVIIQQELRYGDRARSETAAAILRCLAACLTAFLGHQLAWHPSVLPFAVGQLSYAIVLLLDYSRTTVPIASKQGFSLLLRPISDTKDYVLSRFSKPLLRLSGTLYFQSIFKQILTQGDALILSFLVSLSDQGAFALASNYGGLAARLLFQPIEEDSRNVFGRLTSESSTDKERGSAKLNTAIQRLSNILHFYGIITVGSCCFLDLVLPQMVSVIIGPAWFTPNISQLLSIYCYYIPFMAYNGILDAFVTSVATPTQLGLQSGWMIAFTAGYLAAAYVLLGMLKMGAQGLVIANIFNMTLRICWSLVFTSNYLKDRGVKFPWRESLPHPATIASGLVCAVALRLRPHALLDSKVNSTFLLGQILVAGILFGILVLYSEQNFLKSNMSQFLPERLAQKLNLPQSKPNEVSCK